MGYRKGNSQHSLIRMLEKWKKNLDKPGKCSALFVDLSKAFYCLQHYLLLAKVNAYRLDYKSLKLISSFVSSRKYRTKINSSFSKWEHLLIGVPQESIFSLLLFNIYVWFFFFFFMAECNVANYADDTALLHVKKVVLCAKKVRIRTFNTI